MGILSRIHRKLVGDWKTVEKIMTHDIREGHTHSVVTIRRTRIVEHRDTGDRQIRRGSIKFADVVQQSQIIDDHVIPMKRVGLHGTEYDNSYSISEAMGRYDVSSMDDVIEV